MVSSFNCRFSCRIGAPLSEFELTPMDDLANSIRQWILKKSLEENEGTNSLLKSPVTNENQDDLYDF